MAGFSATPPLMNTLDPGGTGPTSDATRLARAACSPLTMSSTASPRATSDTTSLSANTVQVLVTGTGRVEREAQRATSSCGIRGGRG
jgi:hypothetical protein